MRWTLMIKSWSDVVREEFSSVVGVVQTSL